MTGERTLSKGFMAIIILGVIIVITMIFFTKIKPGISKAALECEYLNNIPFLCSEEDRQQILLAQQQAQLAQQQAQLAQQQAQQQRNEEIDRFTDQVLSKFKICGENSQMCKCSLGLSELIGYMIIITKKPDGKIYLQNTRTGYDKPIEGLDDLYINDRLNNIVTLNSAHNSNHLQFTIRKERWGNLFQKIEVLKITAGYGTNLKKIIELENNWGFKNIDRVAVFKKDNKKGIYIPYYKWESGHIDIPDC